MLIDNVAAIRWTSQIGRVIKKLLVTIKFHSNEIKFQYSIRSPIDLVKILLSFYFIDVL